MKYICLRANLTDSMILKCFKVLFTNPHIHTLMVAELLYKDAGASLTPRGNVGSHMGKAGKTGTKPATFLSEGDICSQRRRESGRLHLC